MTPFTIYIGCGHCGGDLEKVTENSYHYEGSNPERVTVLKCKRHAHHLWVMRAELMRAPVDAAVTEKQRKDAERQRRHRRRFHEVSRGTMAS